MGQSDLNPIPDLGRPSGPSEGVPRVWKWVILSGVAHIVVVTALLVAPMIEGEKPVTQPVYTVDLVGGEKLGGGAGTSLAPPPPKTKPPEEAPEVKSAPPIKETKQESKEAKQETKKAKEIVKPAPDEIKAAKAKAAADARAEMIERVKAKKEAEAKKKAEEDEKRKLADEAEAVKVREQIEGLRKKRIEEAVATRRAQLEERERQQDLERKAQQQKLQEQQKTAEQQAKSTVAGILSGAAGPGVGGTGGGVVKSADFIRYQNIIQDRVRSSWTWVGRRTDLKVIVNLSIHDDGEISGIKLVGTSGDRSFDDSVIRAIRRANPLPAPPESFRNEFSDVNVQFSSKELGS